MPRIIFNGLFYYLTYQFGNESGKLEVCFKKKSLGCQFVPRQQELDKKTSSSITHTKE